MDITAILSAMGSAASGGLLGLLGTGIKHWFDHKAEQAKRQFELTMRKMDREEMELEHQLHMLTIEAQTERDIAIAHQERLSLEAHVAGEIEQAELDMRRESYANDKATYGGGFVDAIRGLMRPVLTLYFALLMALITYQLMQMTGNQLGAANADALLNQVVNTCIFLATTSVTWWFGSRPVKRGH